MAGGSKEDRMRKVEHWQGPQSEGDPSSLKTGIGFPKGEPVRMPGGSWYGITNMCKSIYTLPSVLI